MTGFDKTEHSNETLIHYLGIYCDVNALGPAWQSDLRQTLTTTKDQARSRQFKAELRLGIVADGISLQEFESATSQDFDTIDDLKNWLTELWKALYDDEPLE